MYKAVNLMKKLNPLSITYQVAYAQPVLKTDEALKEQENVPQSLTLIYLAPDNMKKSEKMNDLSQNCQLYVGTQPVNSSEWSYDTDRQLLQFKTASCSGHFELAHASNESHGLIVQRDQAFAVSVIVAPLTYEIDVAKDAAYISTKTGHPVLVYDENSSAWKSAWDKNKQEKMFKLTYQLDSTPVVGQQVFNLTMQFESPDMDLWMPDTSTYTAWIDGDFNINFALNLDETPDSGYELYPSQLVGKLDPFAQVLTGAILTGKKQQTAYGIIGKYIDENTVCGTYQLNDKPDTFSVLGGKLHIQNRQIPDSCVDGTQLRWNFTELEGREELENVIPATGVLHFSSDGAEIINYPSTKTLLNGSNMIKGQRISTDEAWERNPPHKENVFLQENNSHPSYTDLLAMTPYKKDEQGQMQDVVQTKSMNSFMTLLQHYIPTDLYKQFININQEDLPADLRGIFAVKGDDGKDAQTVYGPYTTAYLTSLLSTSTQDEYAGKLNRVRADKYIKSKLSINSIYQKQAPMIYKQEWMKMFPNTQTFIDDQKNNKEYYAAIISEDCVRWKKEAQSSIISVDQESQKVLEDYTAHIDKIVKEAKDKGKYWIYFLLQYSMTSTFLSALQNASLSGVTSASVITQKVQQISALITVLDEDQNSIFVQEFMQMIQMFQLSNILPVLFDFSGDESLADYSYAAIKILNEFAEKYADSANETLANYAKYIKSISVEDFKQLYKCLTYAYNSLDGIFVYSKFVLNFDKMYKQIFGKIPELAAYSCMIGAVVTGIMMLASGKVSWKDLSTFEQTKLIATGVGLFAAAAVKVTQRAMLVNILKPYMGFWKRVGTFFWFSQENKITAISSSYILNSEFKNWFIGEARLSRASLENAAEAARILGYRGVENEKVLVKIIGRNLDIAIVRTLGIIFALAGIVMSSIDLSKGGDDMAVAANSLFLASSCLDLIAIASGMAGFEMASAVFGVIGVASVLVGFILFMIEITKKRPTAIENFAKNQANNMKFYMPYGYDIDSFEIIPPSGSVPSLIGVNIYSGTADQSIVFQANGTASIGKFDGKPATCLGLDVDADGNVRFYTFLENEKSEKIPMYLTHSAENTVKIAPFITDSSDKTQIWICKTTGQSNSDVNKHLISAGFTIEDGNSKHLVINGSKTGFMLSDSSCVWTMEMKAAEAVGISISDITLHTFDRDREFHSHLFAEGSDPKVYSVSPKLPDFMQLDAENGVISQKKGVMPAVTAKTSYKLLLTDALGRQVDPVTFSLQVCEVSEV